MEERRLLLAVTLSFLVLLGYRLLMPPAPQPSPSPATPAAPAGRTPSPGPAPTATPTATPTPTPAPTPVPVTRISDVEERRVEVVAPEASIAFSNRGASLVSWRLKQYLDERGNPEEMVQVAPEGPRPLQVETGDATLDARLRQVLYKATPQRLEIPVGRDGVLTFAYGEGDLEVQKRLRFRAPGYLVDVEASVRRGGKSLPLRVVWGPGVGNPTPEEEAVRGYRAPEVVYLKDGKVERLAPKKIDPEGGRASSVTWAGVESTFFAALFVTPPGQGSAAFRAVSLPQPQGAVQRPLVTVPVGTEKPTLLYVGPKDYDALARLGHHLARVVPVGDWIGPVVVWMMRVLRWLEAWVGSYGWSIVILTVVINVLMAPLRHYSIVNGFKMAKLSPELKVIQERYKKIPALDPRRQEMQKEVSALYARHGMSMGTQMAVGCLPILLTMPFLLAIYRVLEVSIDLRGAAFLWIPDLSHKDPLYITPILMGVTMVLMQRMTPSTMDPGQQRIMMIMPVVLVVMFFAAPAGLNLYWLLSNVCSIVQQGTTLGLIRSREPAPAPARGSGRKERRRR